MIFGHVIDATMGLLLGGYLLLASFGKVKLSKNAEANMKWRAKYGTIAGVAVLLY